MFLLDTNVLSEFRRTDKINAGVATWVGTVHPTDLYLSTVTILEVEIGALRAERRDVRHGRMLTTWIRTKVLPSFAARILPVTTEVVLACARLHVPDPRPQLDALIAATALVHRLTVVTRNTQDFRVAGLQVLDPFSR